MVHMSMEQRIDNLVMVINSIQKQLDKEREQTTSFASLIMEVLHRIKGCIGKLEKNNGRSHREGNPLPEK